MKLTLSALSIILIATSARAESLSDVQSNLATMQRLEAYKNWVEGISADFTTDLCYLFQFRHSHGIAAQPLSASDNFREMYYTKADWNERLKNAYLAHLVLSGRAIKSMADFSELENGGDFLVIAQPSAFTRILTQTPGFKKASRSTECQSAISEDQFKKILLQQDVASKAVATLSLVFRFFGYVGPMISNTKWGQRSLAYLRPLFTKKVAVSTAASTGVATLGLWAHDFYLLANHRPTVDAVNVALEIYDDQLSQDFVAILIDDLYSEYESVVRSTLAHPQDVPGSTDRRHQFVEKLKNFMSKHQGVAIERHEQLTVFFEKETERGNRVDFREIEKVDKTKLTEGQANYLANLRLQLKLDLIFKFYKRAGLA
jgi:hypothetical protein